jgi:hypothetical protein
MRWQIGSSLAALAIAASANMPCWADGPSAEEPRFEVYVGAGYDGRTADITTSGVWSVFGPVTQSGFRLKLDGLGDISGATDASVLSSNFMPTGLKDVTDLMVGYQFKYGPAWIKLYAGAAYEAQVTIDWKRYNYNYGENSAQPKVIGAALAFQTYWPVSDRVWASLSVTWLQPDSSTSIYSRGAYEIYRTNGGLAISAGAEASFSSAGAGSPYNPPTCHNLEGVECYDRQWRSGALLNLRYGANDLTLSGGMSQAYGQTVFGPYSSISPYASISYGRQF